MSLECCYNCISLCIPNPHSYCVLTINLTFPFTLGKLRGEMLTGIREAEEVASDWGLIHPTTAKHSWPGRSIKLQAQHRKSVRQHSCVIMQMDHQKLTGVIIDTFIYVYLSVIKLLLSFSCVDFTTYFQSAAKTVWRRDSQLSHINTFPYVCCYTVSNPYMIKMGWSLLFRHT